MTLPVSLLLLGIMGFFKIPAVSNPLQPPRLPQLHILISLKSSIYFVQMLQLWKRNLKEPQKHDISDKNHKTLMA